MLTTGTWTILILLGLLNHNNQIVGQFLLQSGSAAETSLSSGLTQKWQYYRFPGK